MNKSVKLFPKIVMNLFFIIISVIFIVPLLYIISISFTSNSDIVAHGFRLIPGNPSFVAYNYILTNISMILNAYLISIIVTVAGTLCSLLFTSMLAYVISRKDFALSKYITRYVLFPMLFNGGMVTWYILITQYLHLKNNLFVLILPYVIVPWHVILMRSFMMDLPQALFEAAKIDGASEIGIFFRIVLPLSKPALATVGIFCAFIYWNDWWLSMLYIDSQKLVPIQLLLYRIMKNVEFMAQNADKALGLSIKDLPTEPARMAVCILAAGPMMIVFPFFQKYFVKGLTLGSVKG